GAVRPGSRAGEDFDRLLDACAAYAKSAGARKFRAGVNTARTEAYRSMLAKGFRADMQGVQMLKGGMAGYSRPGVYVLDDWA
ncbi:MAG TPA: hypothetical protein VHB50_22745, partial [Bryobacteraceae bacterium]|nr:hypothetical protein [Bryobacteraceae bacterium]